MKSTCSFLLLAAALFMGSCKSGGSDEAIATDMCGCFNMLKDSLPKEAMVVFEKAAAADNPQETFRAEIQKLDQESIQKVNTALMSTSRPGSPIKDCLKELDKKYKTAASNDQEATKRMVTALKDKKDCDIMLALMRMNLKK